MLNTNVSYKSAVLICILFLSGCLDEQNRNSGSDSTNDSVAMTDTIAPIRTTKMIIEFQIEDQTPRKWTITPELAPDTLIMECPEGDATKVTFTTGLETRTFSLTLDEASPRFNILVNDDITALTEIRCIAPLARYQGDYSLGRSTARDIEADITPILDTYFTDDAPGIILSIVEGDEVLFQRAVGLMGVEAGIPRQVSETFT